MKIYLDFDGTVVEHAFPKIGHHNDGSFEVIKMLQDKGHEIILNTYRIDINQESFKASLSYLNDSGLVNIITEHTKMKYHPSPWLSEVEKGIIYIDDVAQKIPLKPCKVLPSYMVNWDRVLSDLKKVGVL